MISFVVFVLLVAFAMPIEAGEVQKADSGLVLANPQPQPKGSGSTSLKSKANSQQISSSRAESDVDKAAESKKSAGSPGARDSRLTDSIKKTLDQKSQMKEANRF